MNLILLDPADVSGDGHARICGSVAEHVRRVLKKRPGDTLRVGVRGGARGTATLIAWSADEAEASLAVALDPGDRPQRPALDLVLAVPRPQQLKRCLHHAITIGVHRIVLLRTWRVEHGYLSSKWLRPGALDSIVDEGLAQAAVTFMPEILIERSFKPFVEDTLPALMEPGQVGLVCDPEASTPIAAEASALRGQRALLVIGPEGGLLPYEVEAFVGQGLRAVHLGPRILRVETAVPAALAQLSLLTQLSEGALSALGDHAPPAIA